MVANHETQEEGRMVQVPAEAAIASGFAVEEGGEHSHFLDEAEGGAMDPDPD